MLEAEKTIFFFALCFTSASYLFYIPESITTDYFHEALSAAESISNKPDLISKWIVRNFLWTTTVEAIKSIDASHRRKKARLIAG